MGKPYYDDAEIRTSGEREAALLAELPQIIAAAQRNAPAYRQILAGIRPDAIRSRAALAELPLTRKSALIGLQQQRPPFGGFTTIPASEAARIFASPGPIYELEPRRPDFFRMARALYAAGIRTGDLIHNTFSYHLTPAGAMLESAALALG